jgi:hypothetical protein
MDGAGPAWRPPLLAELACFLGKAEQRCRIVQAHVSDWYAPIFLVVVFLVVVLHG